MKKWNATKLMLFLVALIGVLIFLHYLGILQPIEGLLARSFLPIQEKVYLFGSDVNDTFFSRQTKKDLIEENDKLKKEVQGFLVENSELKIYREENDSLRKQLNFFEDKDILI